MTNLFLFVLFVLISWILLFFIVPTLSRSFLDNPNYRSSHLQPTPRGGGVVFVILTSLVSAYSLFYGSSSLTCIAFLFAFPLALVGLVDDCLDLPSSWRYFVQLLTSFSILFSGTLVHNLFGSDQFGAFSKFIIFSLLLVAITAIINFVNFMDGLDGLVASCMVVTLIPMSFLLSWPPPLLVLIGSIVGFLIWNWSPAKVFMGDAGSTYLGAVFAALILQSPSWSLSLAHLLVATPLLADAFICVVRRFLSGHNILKAHRLHLFQRLHQAGWSHARVSLLYLSATTFLAVSVCFVGLNVLIPFVIFIIILGVWLDRNVAVSFNSAYYSSF